MEESNQQFGILSDLSTKWCGTYLKTKVSALMSVLGPIDQRRNISFCSEGDIKNYVFVYLVDLLYAAGLSGQLTLLTEGSVSGRKDFVVRTSNRADYWLILSNTGRPIMVIEVKSPDLIGVLTDRSVAGQICDYMIDAQSFFGQEDIYGITTTFNEWKFMWFPHSSCRATATTIATTTPPSAADPTVQLTTTRRVHSTKVYHHTDPDVAKIIISMLHKSRLSRFREVRLFDAERMYIRLVKDSWLWYRLTLDELTAYPMNLSLCLRGNTKLCTNFTVIKYFCRNTALPKVLLAVAGLKPPILVVVKQIVDKIQMDQELAGWQVINQAPLTFNQLIGGVESLCMPMVIHAQTIVTEIGTKRVMFDFDLTKWFHQDTVVAGELPEPMRLLSNNMQEIVREMNLTDPRIVMKQAIESAANHKVEHADLEWRHVALMPVFNRDKQTLESLRPVFIDFGSIKKHITVQDARDAMLEKMQSISAGCEFY